MGRVSPAWLLGGNGCPAAGRGGLPSPQRQALHTHHLLAMGLLMLISTHLPPICVLCALPITALTTSPFSLVASVLLSARITAPTSANSTSLALRLHLIPSWYSWKVSWRRAGPEVPDKLPCLPQIGRTLWEGTGWQSQAQVRQCGAVVGAVLLSSLNLLLLCFASVQGSHTSFNSLRS